MPPKRKKSPKREKKKKGNPKPRTRLPKNEREKANSNKEPAREQGVKTSKEDGGFPNDNFPYGGDIDPSEDTLKEWKAALCADIRDHYGNTCPMPEAGECAKAISADKHRKIRKWHGGPGTKELEGKSFRDIRMPYTTMLFLSPPPGNRPCSDSSMAGEKPLEWPSVCLCRWSDNKPLMATLPSVAVLEACRIVGHGEEDLRTYPGGIRDMLVRCGLVWLLLPPDIRYIPACWQGLADVLGLEYKGVLPRDTIQAPSSDRPAPKVNSAGASSNTPREQQRENPADDSIQNNSEPNVLEPADRHGDDDELPADENAENIDYLGEFIIEKMKPTVDSIRDAAAKVSERIENLAMSGSTLPTWTDVVRAIRDLKGTIPSMDDLERIIEVTSSFGVQTEEFNAFKSEHLKLRELVKLLDNNVGQIGTRPHEQVSKVEQQLEDTIARAQAVLDNASTDREEYRKRTSKIDRLEAQIEELRKHVFRDETQETVCDEATGGDKEMDETLEIVCDEATGGDKEMDDIATILRTDHTPADQGDKAHPADTAASSQDTRATGVGLDTETFLEDFLSRARVQRSQAQAAASEQATSRNTRSRFNHSLPLDSRANNQSNIVLHEDLEARIRDAEIGSMRTAMSRPTYFWTSPVGPSGTRPGLSNGEGSVKDDSSDSSLSEDTQRSRDNASSEDRQLSENEDMIPGDGEGSPKGSDGNISSTGKGSLDRVLLELMSRKDSINRELLKLMSRKDSLDRQFLHIMSRTGNNKDLSRNTNTNNAHLFPVDQQGTAEAGAHSTGDGDHDDTTPAPAEVADQPVRKPLRSSHGLSTTDLRARFKQNLSPDNLKHDRPTSSGSSENRRLKAKRRKKNLSAKK
ncbi:hypothetical protein PG990_007089 [Apiospora arundinis]